MPPTHWPAPYAMRISPPWPSAWAPRPCPARHRAGACAAAGTSPEQSQGVPSMIGRITGKLLETTPPTVCIETGGIGYEIDVPMSTLYKLPPVGQTASLYTHLAIREDAHVLYGFSSSHERMA